MRKGKLPKIYFHVRGSDSGVLQKMQYTVTYVWSAIVDG